MKVISVVKFLWKKHEFSALTSAEALTKFWIFDSWQNYITNMVSLVCWDRSLKIVLNKQGNLVLKTLMPCMCTTGHHSRSLAHVHHLHHMTFHETSPPGQLLPSEWQFGRVSRLQRCMVGRGRYGMLEDSIQVVDFVSNKLWLQHIKSTVFWGKCLNYTFDNHCRLYS